MHPAQTWSVGSRLSAPRQPARGLERRTSRGGRDSIDHAPGGHDDLANAAAGAIHLVLGEKRRITWSDLYGNGGLLYDENGRRRDFGEGQPAFEAEGEQAEP